MTEIAAQIALNRTHLVCGGSMRPLRHTNYSRGNDVRRKEMLNERESQYHHFNFRVVSSFPLACSASILFEIIRVDKK